MPITPQPVSTSIALTGKLLPLQGHYQPDSGKVGQVMVRYGDVVKVGQPLSTMDTSEAMIKYREAKAAYIKAQNSYQQMEKWDASADVARRTVPWQRQNFHWKTRKDPEESERLYKKGIIPATEYESTNISTLISRCCR